MGNRKNALWKAIFYWFTSFAVFSALNNSEKIAEMTEFTTAGASIVRNRRDWVVEWVLQ
jgi:hypothetical protein